MNSVRIYDFNLTANGIQDFPVSGHYFRIMSCTGAVSVTLDQGSVVGPIVSGQGLRSRTFHRLIIKDASGAINKGSIIIADEDFVDNNTTGTVNILDADQVLSKGGTCFALASASATLNAYFELWNPASNTKRGIVTQYTVSAFSATWISVRLTNAKVGSGSTGGLNKWSPAAAGSLICSCSGMTGAPTSLGQYDQFTLAANAIYCKQPKNPIVLEPGYGLFIQSNASAASTIFSADWKEELI